MGKILKHFDACHVIILVTFYPWWDNVEVDLHYLPSRYIVIDNLPIGVMLLLFTAF